MITLDDALSLTLAHASRLDAEPVSLAAARDRVLAEALSARGSAPRVAVSAMDGFAVRDTDLARLPARLPVRGRTFAGASDGGVLEAGTCVRIFTGAPVPDGADRVVIQEQVCLDGETAVFETPLGSARHVRPAGSDFEAGSVLLEAGRRLDARALVAAAAADHATLTVVRRPRVAVLGTGDELAEPGCALETPGAIPDSVSFGIAALVEAWGGEIIERRRLVDDPIQLEAAARQALEAADLIVVTGGASVGERDFAKSMFAANAPEMLFSKVAIKPGKPVWLAHAAGRLVLGLPGNPTSALVTARLFLAPLIAGLSGREPASALAWREARLKRPLGAVGDRETLERGYSDGPFVAALSNQDSGAQSALARADVLIRRRAGDPALAEGASVSVLDF